MSTAKTYYQTDFYNEILIPLFPQLKALKGIRRILLDVEAGEPLTLTVELLPKFTSLADTQPIMKHYELVEIEPPPLFSDEGIR